MDRPALQERFGLLGTSPALYRVLDRVRLVARTDVTVLLQGESGVGKELLAQALHGLSGRRHGPLVIVNCGAIPEGLIESELFGAEKGAYTGSVERRTGYFEEADGGTVFLDEVGELPPAAQVRLLRVLETGQYARVGSSQTRTADVRVVAATNRDLGREVQAGRFREDLYYRLSTVLIDIPPLRARREDIGLLFEHFVRRFTDRYRTGPRRLDADAARLLDAYTWPGNVRELRNVAEQAVVLSTADTLTADLLRPMLRGVAQGLAPSLVPARLPEAEPPGFADDTRARELLYRALLELRFDVRELREQMSTLLTALQVTREDFEEAAPAPRGEGFVILRDGPRGGDPPRHAEPEFEDAPFEIATDDAPLPAPEAEPAADAPIPRLEDVERRLIAEALRRYEGNRRRAAAALGISERTLYRKIKELEAQGVAV
jgi:DNA-binding NtrC family response regulator